MYIIGLPPFIKNSQNRATPPPLKKGGGKHDDPLYKSEWGTPGVVTCTPSCIIDLKLYDKTQNYIIFATIKIIALKMAKIS